MLSWSYLDFIRIFRILFLEKTILLKTAPKNRMSVLTEANADHRFHSRSGGQPSRCVSMERNRDYGGDTCAIRGEKKNERERERELARRWRP